jgi:CRISPR system Cascade subunit CasE
MREPVDTVGDWDLKTRPFEPQLAIGQRLHFRTKVVATRSKSLRGQTRDAKRGKREDVVIAAWRRHGVLNKNEEARAQIGYAAACEWLISQGAKRGFVIPDPTNASLSIGDLTTHTFRGDHAARQDSRRLGATFSSLVFEGTLDITDCNQFQKLLAEGFGTERAFGFGLVQVAPIHAVKP